MPDLEDRIKQNHNASVLIEMQKTNERIEEGIGALFATIWITELVPEVDRDGHELIVGIDTPETILPKISWVDDSNSLDYKIPPLPTGMARKIIMMHPKTYARHQEKIDNIPTLLL